MKRKWWTLLTMAAVIVFVLAGCGSQSTKSKASSGTTSGGKTQVVFWHAMTGNLEKTLQGLADTYNQSQNKYEIKLQAQGDYTTLQQKIMASGASKSLPTMAQTTYTSVPDMVHSKLIAPLTSYVEGKNGLSSADLADIYPGFLESSKIGKTYYSLPFSKSTRVMFYNKDILDKYHLAVPKTWEDVEKIGAVLKEDNIYAMGFENDFSIEYETLARQMGADYLNTEKGTTDIGGADSVKAMTLIKDLLDKGYARTAGEDKYFSGPFAQGKSALYIGSSAGVSFVKSSAPKTLNWGTAVIPTENGKELTQFAGNDLVIFNSASKEQKAGAFAFMKYLLGAKQTAKWSMESGYLPLRKSALKLSDYQTFLTSHPEVEAANKELSYGYATDAFIGYGKFRTSLLDSLDQIVTKKADVSSTLKKLSTTTKAILKANQSE